MEAIVREQTAPPHGIVGVQLHPVGSVHPCRTGPLTLRLGERVLVETERGAVLATVADLRSPTGPAAKGREGGPWRALRRAEPADFEKIDRNRRRAADAERLIAARIRERRLPMKLVRVEVGFEGTRATVYFFAEKRVDFRALVRDLAAELHLRIEMRQIGARDETKLVGGLGPCGRELCCSSWLREFHAVSVKMAKAQDLSLAPSKLAGMCGRLKCCLRYEYETYLELRRELPKPGTRVLCVKGDGRVVRQIPIRSRVVVRRDEDGVEVEATLEDLVQPRGEA